MISIVVPTTGRSALSGLLQSVNKYGSQFERYQIEVIVSVDMSKAPPGFNAGETNSSTLPLTVVQSQKPGVNAARNLGVRSSRGDILWFLDDDVELIDLPYESEIQSGFVRSDVMALGGDYRTASSAKWFERGYNTLCSLWRFSAGVPEREQLLGGTLLVRRSAWETLKGFDESIEYGGSETLFVARLQALGRTCFRSGLSVVHHPGDRSLETWGKIAIRQSHRKSGTARHLPSIHRRMKRSIRFILGLDGRSVLALTLFGPPFLCVSILSRCLRPR